MLLLLIHRNVGKMNIFFQLDSRSFMSSYAAPGASEATSFVSLLGVAYALGQLTEAEKEDLSQNVVFVLLDGVSNLTVYELMLLFFFV